MSFDDTLRALIADIVREEVRRALADGTPQASTPAEVEYLDDKQVAARVGMSPQTFRQMRCDGEGPPFVRVGRAVRYRWADVSAWLEARTVGRRRVG